MLLLVVSLVQTLSSEKQSRNTNINALNKSMDEISIKYNPTTTRIFGAWYDINVESQNSFDLKIELDDDDWAFQSDAQSTFMLTIDGLSSTNTNNDTSINNNNELIMVFSVGDEQFFSFLTYISSTNLSNKIYPKSTLNTKESVPSWVDDTTLYQNRYDRLSDGGQWKITSPITYNQQSLWPLKFVITNNPLKNECIFSFLHNDKDKVLVQNIFEDSFEDDDITIYIMGGSDGINFQISRINIQLIPNSDDANLMKNVTNEISINNENDIIQSSSTQSPSYSINDTNKTISQNNETVLQTRYIFIIDDDIPRATNTGGQITKFKNKNQDRSIETWFVVILTASLLIFCCARLIMKIPMEKFCILPNEEDDHEIHQEITDMTDDDIMEPDGTEYNYSCHTTGSTNDDKDGLSVTEINGTTLKETNNRSPHKVGDEDKVYFKATSPSISHSIRSVDACSIGKNDHLSLRSMDTISDHGRRLSSVVDEVEQTRQLEIIQEEFESSGSTNDDDIEIETSKTMDNVIGDEVNNEQDSKNSPVGSSEELYIQYETNDDREQEQDDRQVMDSGNEVDQERMNENSRRKRNGGSNGEERTEYIYLTM